MIKQLRRAIVPVLSAALALGLGGCHNRHPQPSTQTYLAPGSHSLANGAYAVLREAATPQEAHVPDAGRSAQTQVVIAYDRRTYSGAPPDEPLVYVTIDPDDYVPLVIEGTPLMTTDGQGKDALTVSLSRRYVQRAEDFTRAHLGGRIATVVDGQIVTLHKVRSVVMDGKLQITRCTDKACAVIRSKLVD